MPKGPTIKTNDLPSGNRRPENNRRVPKVPGTENIDELYPSEPRGFIDVPTTVCERVGRLANELDRDSKLTYNACQKLNLELRKLPLPEQIASLETHIANHIEVQRETPSFYREDQVLTLCLLQDLLLDRERLLQIEDRKKKNNALLGLSTALGERIEGSDPAKRELTLDSRDTKAAYDDELDKKRNSAEKLDRRQITVLLYEFIDLFENADNTKIGKFIAAISPYEYAKGISDDLSNINHFSSEYADIVKHWRGELKSTKRGRPRINKYKKIT